MQINGHLHFAINLTQGEPGLGYGLTNGHIERTAAINLWVHVKTGFSLISHNALHNIIACNNLLKATGIKKGMQSICGHV